MTARETFEAAYSRGTYKEIAHEAAMRDISDLEGMRNDLREMKVAHTSDIQQRMLEMIERMADHLEAMMSAIMDDYDSERAARRLIETLDNPRWRQVLACRYLKQMRWSEVAERLHSTDSAVRMAAARAIECLEAREKI